MSKINLLTSKVFNRIAAGEVVERPSSVVKELVENSIDAGSKNITVEIVGGGISKIVVIDDGAGIEKEDLKKALMPHATSKISSVSDLDAISTLGFRGEALPSIASVSKLLISSKPSSQEEGYEIYSEGGETSDVKPCGMANGTVVTVRNLFFNTPAREKFLKTERAEESDVSYLMARFILGNPDVSFKFISDGKTVYNSYGDGEESAFIAVYGVKELNDCYRIDNEKNGIRISGYIGKHYNTKGNRTHMTVFLNGRYIVNTTVFAAITNAYGAYLMKRQYPFCAIKIEIPVSEVDVNVHPSKTDVRFSNNQIVYGAIYSTISKVLDGTSEALSIVKKDDSGMVGVKPEQISLDNKDKNYDFTINKNPKFEKIIFKDSGAPALSESEQPKVKSENPEFVDIFAENKAYIEKLEREKREREEKEPEKLKVGGELFYIGQALNTFLIFEDGENLYIVDQHAAHERLLFDKFNAELENKNVEIQPLLVPVILNVNGAEFSYLESKADVLTSMGFEMTEFGTDAFKVSSLPVFLSNINVEEFFKNLLSDLNELKTISATSVLKDMIAKKACKAAVKSGDKLSDMEVKTLMEMMKGDLGIKCPHGRPAVVKITRYEIDKWFKRIV